MDLGLEGRTVLVTGASGGIGRALAEAFALEGARVACHTFRRADGLRSWLDGRPWKDRAEPVNADLTKPAKVAAMFHGAVERFGRVDVCVANAGVRPAAGARLDEAEEARIRETVEGSFFTALWTAREFLRTLAATGPHPDGGGAALLFVGSTAARFGERRFADYAAAKSALSGLMRTLKNEIVEIDPRARVNLVEPGWTRTWVERPELDDPALVARALQTVPLKKVATADDIARTALWLCSPTAAAHVTGQVVTVAGGMEGRVV